MDTKEDDKTHIKEVIELHDLTKDSTVSSYEAHEKRTLNNFETRIVHHHTYDMKLVLNLLDYAEFKLIDFQVFSPYHLLAIAQKVSNQTYNNNKIIERLNT